MDDDQNTAKLNEDNAAKGFVRPSHDANIDKIKRYLALNPNGPKADHYKAQLAEFQKRARKG